MKIFRIIQFSFYSLMCLLCSCYYGKDVEDYDLPGSVEERPDGVYNPQDSMPDKVIPVCSYGAFREGTVWQTECRSFYSPDVEYEFSKIEGNTIVGNRTCMNLWHETANEGKKLIAYLFAEEDRIFFILPYDTAHRYLFYDFGIIPGEKADIVPFEDCSRNDWQELRFYQKLDYSYEFDNCGHCYTMLKMTTCYEHYEGDPDPQIRTQEWIKGIGSTRGLLMNCEWAYFTGNVRKELIFVTVDGEILYRKY